MSVKAKFICVGVVDKPEFQAKTVNFLAATEGEENKSFSKYTPAGQLSMQISYETPAVEFFEVGKQYFLTFENVE